MVTRDDRLRFVDTNILLAATDAKREQHGRALELLKQAYAGNCGLYTSGQVFREYLVVATRPIESNGLGLKIADALENVEQLGRCIDLLEENSNVSRRLRSMLRSHDVSGKRIHDANIVATMLTHGLKNLITDNRADFEAFSEITIDW